MKVEVIDFYSNILQRNLKVEITGHFGYPILMFPTSQGSYLQNRDFKLIDSVEKWIDEGKIKLFNIETLDSENLYKESVSPEERIQKFENYEQFLYQEFFPYLQKIHNVHRIAVAGCSFGGFHAANFAFKFPDAVSHMFCLSGAFSVRGFMDGFSNDLVYFNCADEFVAHDEAWKYNHMNIVLSTSDEDICLGKTQKMAAVLREKGINHWYDEKKWIAHDWPLWRMVFPEFIGTFFS